MAPVGDGCYEVGRGGCCTSGRQFIFVALGGQNDEVDAYNIATGVWEDISIDNDVCDARAMAYELGSGRRLFLICDGDDSDADSLYVYWFDEETGIEGEWAEAALPAPFDIEPGVALAFAPLPDDPVLSGYLYLLRGGNTKDFYRRRFTRSFIVPEIAGPMDGVRTKPDYTVLDWRATTTTATYDVQVDNSADFGSPEVDTTVACGELKVPNGKLSVNTTYYWHVRSNQGAQTSDWSDAETFVTSATSATGGWAVFPPDDAKTSGDETYFDWPSAAYATAYELVVKPTTSGTPVLDETLAVSEYSSQEKLTCGDYQWKYRSKNQYNVWSSWSSWYDLDVSWSWETMASIPSDVDVEEGGALCYGEDLDNHPCIWALVGNGSNEFWKYVIAGDSWLEQDSTHDGQYGGSALVTNVNQNQVHATLGQGSDSLHKFDVGDAVWDDPTVALPASCDFGSCLAYVGAVYLVVARDEDHNFYRRDADQGDGEETQSSVPLPSGGLVAAVATDRSCTRVRYVLPGSGPVRVTVTDLTGRTVAVLARGVQPAGEHDLRWYHRGTNGARVSSGAYFVRVESPSGTRTLKTVLER